MKVLFDKYSVFFGASAALLIVMHHFFVDYDNLRHFESFWRLSLTVFCVATIGFLVYRKASEENIETGRILLLSLLYTFIFFGIFFTLMISFVWAKTGRMYATEILVEGINLIREKEATNSKLVVTKGSNKTVFYVSEDMVIGSNPDNGITVIVFKNPEGTHPDTRCLIFPERYSLNACKK